MEKMPHRGDGQVHHHPAEHLARSHCVKHPLSDFNLATVGVDLSSSSAHNVFPSTAIWDVRYAVLESGACWKRLVRLPHHTTDGMRISHRSSQGLEPINLLGYNAVGLSEYLRYPTGGAIDMPLYSLNSTVIDSP
jgi:hypothetical protein